MKKINVYVLFILVYSVCHAQTQKTFVCPAGGGASQSAEYINFSAIGQPLSAGSTGTFYLNREGFIFAQQNRVTATISGNDTICFNTTASALTSSYSGAEGNITYQWQKLNATLWQDIAQATSSGFSPGALTQTTFYRLVVNDKSGPGKVSSDTVKITVRPTPVGGQATGGAQVCYGSSSTLLAAVNITGHVVRWQRSAVDTLSWTNISGSSGSTYTAVNDTVATWYRAVVKSGVCTAEVFSSPAHITISLKQISGYARYENNPKTPLSDLKITLKKIGTNQEWATNTNSMGFYSFAGLINGNYNIRVSSAHPSGQWQTWNGVNLTDYLLVYKHATTGPLLPDSPPVIRIAGDVKVPKTPPVITTADATAIQMAAKYGWGNPAYFDIPKWVFSGLTSALRIDTFALACADVTRDIRGLCAGDVNGSYLPPNGYKTGENAVGTGHALSLQNAGTIPITRDITFPVRAGHAMELGAITLMLDFDPALVEITGVEMPENGGVEPWYDVTRDALRVTGDALRVTRNELLSIGWMSLEPVEVEENGTVLWIHARLKDESLVTRYASRVTTDLPNIRFTLNDSPLSELADGQGNPLPDALLLLPDGASSGKTVRWQNGENPGLVSVYPNPTSDILHVEYILNEDVNVQFALMNMAGVMVLKSETGAQKAGWHKEQLDLKDLAPGVYNLKVTMGEETVVKRVVVR